MKTDLPDKKYPPKLRVCGDEYITVNRSALRLIGSPRNIQFWWSGQENMLLIGGCGAITQQSFGVADYYYHKSISLKIQNKNLISIILSLTRWKKHAIYHAYGVYFPELNMMGFKADKAVIIEKRVIEPESEPNIAVSDDQSAIVWGMTE